MSEKQPRVSRYFIALSASIIVNTILFLQPLASAVSFLGLGRAYPYVNSQYSILGFLIFPFIAGLGYYLLTSDKRIGFPFSVQLGTVALSTVIVIADTIQPSNSALVLYSYITYVQDLLLLIGFSFALLVVFGVMQALALRVILGLEIREQPETATFTVNIPLPELLTRLDEEFLTSHALRKRKTDIEGVSLFSTRRSTGEEVAVALAAKDDQNSVVSFSCVRELAIRIGDSDPSKMIMRGLIRGLEERALAGDTTRVFTPSPSHDDPASHAVLNYLVRKTRTSFTRARVILTKVRRKVSISFRDIPKAYLVFGIVVVVMMGVVGFINPPNLVEIEVILTLGLILDLGVAIQQARDNARQA